MKSKKRKQILFQQDFDLKQKKVGRRKRQGCRKETQNYARIIRKRARELSQIDFE
jgi:hypothetical protein